MTKTIKHHQPVTDEAVEGATREYKDIHEDYRYHGGLFDTDDERVARTKWIIDHILTEADRILILLYADCQSYRKLGARLNISHTLVAKHIRRIKKQIIEEYNKLNRQ